MKKRLINKIALIIRTGSGVGRSMSLRFAKEGVKVIVVDMTAYI